MNLLRIAKKVGTDHFLQVTEVSRGFHLALFQIRSEDHEFMSLGGVVFTEWYEEEGEIDRRVAQIETDIDSVLMEQLL